MNVPDYLGKLLETYDGDNLVNLLNAIQEKEGYLPESVLKIVSEKIGMPLSRIYAAASFYAFFKLEKKGMRTILVCNSPSCYLNDSTNVIEVVKRITGLAPGEFDDEFCFEIAQCIGCCDEAPAMMIDGKVHGNLTEEKIIEVLGKL